MIDCKNILVPIDFSPASQSSARYAQTIARSFGARITLLHVLAPLESEFAFIEPQDDKLRGLLHERTSRTQSELDLFLAAELSGCEVERTLAEGRADKEIIACARDSRADMIIMPTHGYGPLRRFLIGSVTAKVLDEANLPVWTGVHFPKTERSVMQLTSVVCALDLGPASAKVLAFASSLCVRFSAKLTLLHAVAERGEDAGEYSDQNWRVSSANRLRVRMEELQAAAGTKAEIILESGSIQEVVAEAAQRLKADAVIIGRSHPSDAFGRLRTHAYAIIRQSPCPVVSV
jgi:nucleotide-binding universal stress UspA family protein